jgi:UDP-glucose 4-epimerase
MILINAHSVQMNIYFAKQPMNVANLHDDPEIQKKLQSKMKMPLSYFEKNTDELEGILHVMQKHGADAVSVHQQSIDFDVNQAVEKIKEARLRGPDDMYHYVRFDFLFLTQPLASA